MKVSKKWKNLDEEYWDDLSEKYPGYVDHFIIWLKSDYLDMIPNNLRQFTLDDFYFLPLSMQLGIWYEYVSYQNCGYEIYVCDTRECIDSIEEYFAETRSHDLIEKQRSKCMG